MVTKENSKFVIETCNRFLNAAEQIYIQKGYYGTSIRAIAKSADRSIGTLHHYWGSKQELFKELFERRFAHMRDQHSGQFSKLKKRVDQGQTVQLREIIQALVESFYIETKESTENKDVHRLLGRTYSDPAQEIIDLMGNLFQEPIEMMIDSLRHVCPDLHPDEFRIRVLFILNIINHQESANHGSRFDVFMPPKEISSDKQIKSVVNFLVAAMEAPPAF